MTDDRNPGAPAPAPADSAGNLMNFARGAKAVALLCFLLPWAAISCAGQPMVKMSGLDLATGNVPPIANPAAGFPGASSGPSMPNFAEIVSVDIFVIIAAVLIAAGLVATFVLPRRRAALVGMITAAGAIAVSAFDVLIRLKGEVMQSIRDSSAAGGASGGDREMQQFGQMISVEGSIGFWLNIAALIAAIVLLKMVHGRPGDPYSG